MFSFSFLWISFLFDQQKKNAQVNDHMGKVRHFYSVITCSSCYFFIFVSFIRFGEYWKVLNFSALALYHYIFSFHFISFHMQKSNSDHIMNIEYKIRFHSCRAFRNTNALHKEIQSKNEFDASCILSSFDADLDFRLFCADTMHWNKLDLDFFLFHISCRAH